MARTVLVADDSPVIQNKAKGILTGEGFEVVTVSNGVAAIKKLPQINPLVILADVSMPGKDGYEVCDFVKNSPQLRHVPVVLVVSDMEDYNEQRAAQVHADGFISKRATKTPFDPQELISTVSKFVAQCEAAAPRPEPPAPVVPPPAPPKVFDLSSEEPPAPAKSAVDFGSLSGDIAFTESAAEGTPAGWADQAPPVREPPRISEAAEPPPAALPAGDEAPTVLLEQPLVARPTRETPAPAEPVFVDEPLASAPEPVAEAPKPRTPERTMMFRVPAEIAGPVLRDDLAPAPPAPILSGPATQPPPAPPGLEAGRVAATSLESFSLSEAATGQVRFASPESEGAPAAEVAHEGEVAPAAESFQARTSPVESVHEVEPAETPRTVEAPPEYATVAPEVPSLETAPPAPIQSGPAAETAVPVIDVNLVYKIVNKVVTKTSPAAIPLKAIEEMVDNLVDEIVAELHAEFSQPESGWGEGDVAGAGPPTDE